MDNSLKKRAETARRKKEAEALLGTPGIAKPSGPVSNLKHSHQHSNSSPSASPSALVRPPPHHTWKKSPVGEKLARLFEDSPASVASTTPMAQPGPSPAVERPRSARQSSSTSSDVEMMEAGPASSHRVFSDPAEDFLGPVILPDDEDDEDYEDDQDGEDDEDEDSEDGDDGEKDATTHVQGPMLWNLSSVSSGQFARQVKDEVKAGGGTGDLGPSVEMAAPDRPYTKWRGQCPFQGPDTKLYSSIPPDHDGSLNAAHGALIPEGYQLFTTTPGYPWICAIRSCRKVFAQIGQLGRHFNVSRLPQATSFCCPR